MTDFETLLTRYLPPLRRWIACRVRNEADAEDLLQDICLAASLGFSSLRDEQAFHGWVLGIARNKYADWARKKAKNRELPLDGDWDRAAEQPEETDTLETLRALPERDRIMLTLFYERNLPQHRIAAELGIPVGTVKSRLHTARERFRSAYPHPPKGEKKMRTLPKKMPAYVIRRMSEPPFPVKWEETPGWFIVPRLGETCLWGMYDQPSGKLDVAYDMRVTGEASVHGQQGVEILARLLSAAELDKEDLMRDPVNESGAPQEEWRFIAQIKDDHTRFLSAERNENGVKTLTTFLDPEFMDNWGAGENNQGNPVYWAPRGIIRRQGDAIECGRTGECSDVTGRYEVTLDGETYDTVCILSLRALGEDVVSEQYVDAKGHTVLWRRFNGNEWRIARYGRPWTELLPGNERITADGRVYVHWYDCLCVR